MTKKELVEDVVKKTRIKKEIIEVVVDTLLEVTIDGLVMGKKVKWPGLGEFIVTTKGINPLTGAELTIPKTIVFIPKGEEF